MQRARILRVQGSEQQRDETQRRSVSADYTFIRAERRSVQAPLLTLDAFSVSLQLVSYILASSWPLAYTALNC